MVVCTCCLEPMQSAGYVTQLQGAAFSLASVASSGHVTFWFLRSRRPKTFHADSNRSFYFDHYWTVFSRCREIVLFRIPEVPISTRPVRPVIITVSVPTSKCWYNTLKKPRPHFPAHPSQFIIHHARPVDSIQGATPKVWKPSGGLRLRSCYWKLRKSNENCWLSKTVAFYHLHNNFISLISQASWYSKWPPCIVGTQSCSVGITTGYGPRFDSRQCCIFSSPQRADRPWDPPIQWVRVLGRGVKRQGLVADQSSPSSAEIKIRGAISRRPHMSSWHNA
jgi:hypothetical protein